MTSDTFFTNEYYSNGVVSSTEEMATNEKFIALYDLVISLQDRIEELETALSSRS